MRSNVQKYQFQEVVDLSQRLGRHVEHDPQSLEYPITVSMSAELRSVTHERKTAILNQGNLGSCTGNAGTGLLGTEPFYSQLPADVASQLNEAYAVQLYEKATIVDGFPGTYPPDDTGSSGLGIGRALKAWGLVKAYRHAFGLLHALQALQLKPVIIGIPWFSSFDSPGPNGLLTLDDRSSIRGGHELELLAIDVTNGDPNDPQGRVRGANSWGESWGDQGYFEMDFQTFGDLLKRQGDVMTLTLR